MCSVYAVSADYTRLDMKAFLNNFAPQCGYRYFLKIQHTHFNYGGGPHKLLKSNQIFISLPENLSLPFRESFGGLIFLELEFSLSLDTDL
jgi:hypothetical protein